MANASIEFKETRFIIEEDTTEVYVLCVGHGDCPHFVHGWHHKSFPATIATVEIMNSSLWNELEPILWDLKLPPNTAVKQPVDPLPSLEEMMSLAEKFQSDIVRGFDKNNGK